MSAPSDSFYLTSNIGSSASLTETARKPYPKRNCSFSTDPAGSPTAVIQRLVTSGMTIERTPESRGSFLELLDRVAFVGLHQIGVPTLDPTVGVEILAEIGARHRLIHLALNESLVRLGH